MRGGPWYSEPPEYYDAPEPDEPEPWTMTWKEIHNELAGIAATLANRELGVLHRQLIDKRAEALNRVLRGRHEEEE